MAEPSDLQAESNRWHRLYKELRLESNLIILVSVALICAVISWFRAETAIDNAKEAIAASTTWQQMYYETERECRLAQLEIDSFRMELVKAGFEIPHDGEKP